MLGIDAAVSLVLVTFSVDYFSLKSKFSDFKAESGFFFFCGVIFIKDSFYSDALNLLLQGFCSLSRLAFLF